MFVEQKQINCSNLYFLIFDDDICFGRGYLMEEDKSHKWTKFDTF